MDLEKQDRELKQMCAQKLAMCTQDDDVVEKFKLNCLKNRGCAGIKSFGAVFRMMDDSRDRKIDLREFIDGCRGRGVFKMTDEELKKVFSTFDKDGSGFIDYEELLRGIRPKLNEARQKLVDSVFDFVANGGLKKRALIEQCIQEGADPSKYDSDDLITVEDLMVCYKVDRHPKYLNGEMSKKDVLMEFLKNLEGGEGSKDGCVSRNEWCDYYAGLSVGIEDDNYFRLMITNSWGDLSGNPNPRYKKGDAFQY